ncbi:hypothetical protein AGOR_G00121370 [Albula goreensis]|uniref:Uncharacterized protein n=1 Tax=Albula goreensis TaxID=1534307 RepID=A0A8T3DAU1_9TELE|nr:hypothetical protein AGOR_G00121370 [Albula goreensis]
MAIGLPHITQNRDGRISMTTPCSLLALLDNPFLTYQAYIMMTMRIVFGISNANILLTGSQTASGLVMPMISTKNSPSNAPETLSSQE